MNRYKELGKLGQDIHDLLNEKVDKELAAANATIEIELEQQEEKDKEMLAELERSKEENTLLHLLRQVYRSMTGQVLDIGAGKELQRKFKEERAKRIKRIKEQRAQEDTPDPISDEQIELEQQEEKDKEMLAELERSKEENTLLHLLRQVYRSMTGQVLDIGAGKELQRKFKEERAKRIKRIKEQRAQEDTPDPISDEQREFLTERRRRLDEQGE